jgi:hypothetical protein
MAAQIEIAASLGTSTLPKFHLTVGQPLLRMTKCRTYQELAVWVAGGKGSSALST